MTSLSRDYTLAGVSQVSYLRRGLQWSQHPCEELAPLTEEQVQGHLAAGKLVEGLQHMSPKYLEGMRRILTVSADTEFVSAPSYLRAAQHAPALNNFGSAMSIIQDELAHAHIGYRLLGDLGVDTDWLVYERPAAQFKYPYAFDVPLNSWVELVCANALYDQAGFVLLSDVYQSSTFGPWKRALAKVDKEETFHLRHGRTWLKKLVKDPDGKQQVQAALDWMFILTLEWFGLPDDRKKHSEQLDYGFKGKSNDQLRQEWMAAVVPFMEEIGIDVPAHLDPEQGRYVIDCPFPAQFDEEKRTWLLDDGAIEWDQVIVRWRARGPDERGLRAHAAARLPDDRPAEGRMSTVTLTQAEQVEARLWDALRRVEDPEIPVSVVGMGLIVSLAFEPEQRRADLQITFTSMGCPAMEFIEDDIREALLPDPDVEAVEIEVVWDPVWTKDRLRDDARATMRRLGILA